MSRSVFEGQFIWLFAIDRLHILAFQMIGHDDEEHICAAKVHECGEVCEALIFKIQLTELGRLDSPAVFLVCGCRMDNCIHAVNRVQSQGLKLRAISLRYRGVNELLIATFPMASTAVTAASALSDANFASDFVQRMTISMDCSPALSIYAGTSLTAP